MSTGVCARAARATGLTALSDDVLENIFVKIPFVERARTVPLICRATRELDRKSRHLWRQVCLPATIQVASRNSEVRFNSFHRWLLPRSGVVQEFDLAVMPYPSNLLGETRVWGVVHAMLCSVAPTLTRLHLEWLGTLVVGDWVVGMTNLQHADLIACKVSFTTHLAALRQLQDLWVVGERLEFPPTPRGAALLQAEGGGTPSASSSPPPCLPLSLTALSLSRAHVKALPPNLGALTNLISLDLSYTFIWEQPDLNPLTALTQLQELTCSWCRLDHVPPQLSRLTSLRVLYLHECFPRRAPSDEEFMVALTPLSRLGMLSLSSCNLRSVPSVVLGMTTLRGLHLEDNSRRLVLPPGPYLSRLLELVIDWGTLLGSHEVLRGATQMTKLYASRPPPRREHQEEGSAEEEEEGLGLGLAWPPEPPEQQQPPHEPPPPPPPPQPPQAWFPVGYGQAMQQMRACMAQVLEAQRQLYDAQRQALLSAGTTQHVQAVALAEEMLVALSQAEEGLQEAHQHMHEVFNSGEYELVPLPGPWEEGEGGGAGGGGVHEAAAAPAPGAGGGEALLEDPHEPPADPQLDGPPLLAPAPHPALQQQQQWGEGGEEEHDDGGDGWAVEDGGAVGGNGGVEGEEHDSTEEEEEEAVQQWQHAQHGGVGAPGPPWGEDLFWGRPPPGLHLRSQGDHAPATAVEVTASLAAVPALAYFVDVFPPPSPRSSVILDPLVAQVMYMLPARCPQLTPSVLQSNSFGWRLEDLRERERKEGQVSELKKA